MDNTTKFKILKHRKSIIIYSHTSKFDFLLAQLYSATHPEFRYDTYAIIHENLFNVFPITFGALNVIPATARQKENGGFIQRTVDKFKNKERYRILISPEGTLVANPWRSGYKFLAEGLNVPITVLGYDYVDKKLKCINSIENLKINDLEHRLQDMFYDIVPRYVDCSYTPVRMTLTEPSFIDWLTFTSFILPFYPAYLIWKLDTYLFVVMFTGWVVSTLYHSSCETEYKDLEPVIIKFCFVYFFSTMYYYELFVVDFMSVLIFISCYLCYKMGCGRKLCKDRTEKYANYHLLFHFTGCLLIVYPLVLNEYNYRVM